METKICTKCGVEKSIAEFSKNRSKKEGINTWCKECTKDYSRKYYQENIDKAKIYHLKNKDKIKKYQKIQSKKYRLENAEKIRKEKKRYYESYYKVARRERIARYERERRKAGKVNRLNKNMSLGIWKSLKYSKNGNHWEDLVGYTLNDLKKHLEKQFTIGMSWANYGRNGWEVDHKIPISLFNVTGINSKGFKKAWSLENLQPLWKSDNASKRDKLFVA